MDLRNARIIEWDVRSDANDCVAATFTASRRRPGKPFEFINLLGGARVADEADILASGEIHNLRIVAEFPPLSLADLVGDAPAFLATYVYPERFRERCIAFRVGSGQWLSASLEADGLRRLANPMDNVDPATVVPLVPREVVS